MLFSATSRIVREDGGKAKAAPVYFHAHGDVVYLPTPQDPDQPWLPLPGLNVVYPLEEEAPKMTLEERHAHSIKNVRQRSQRKFAHMEGWSRQLYQPRLGVDQYVLPFKEGQRISNKAFDRLIKCEFPCFERDSEENLYRVDFPLTSTNDATLFGFLDEMCHHRYAVKKAHGHSYQVYLERYRDFVAVRLRFSCEY